MMYNDVFMLMFMMYSFRRCGTGDEEGQSKHGIPTIYYTVCFNEPSHSVSFSLNMGFTLGKNNTNLTLYKPRRYL